MSKTGRICHWCQKLMPFSEGIVSDPPVKAYWHITCAYAYVKQAMEDYSNNLLSRDGAADVLLAMSPALKAAYENLLDRALEEA